LSAEVCNANIELESVSCNLCGSDDLKYLYRKPDTRYFISEIEFNVVQCKRCGLAFVNPRPTCDSIDIFYPKEFYQARIVSQTTRARYEKEAKYLEEFEPGRILDIGCAEGGFLKILQSKGWEVYGTDYTDKGENIYNLDIRYGELDTIQYPSEYFDVITAWAVFEHLHDPMKYFREVSRILKVGGSFILLVTNINSLMSRYGYGEDIPRHLYFFSERTLKAFADRVNLSLVNVDFSYDIYSNDGRDAIRVILLRWVGVPWQSITGSGSLPSSYLRILNRMGRIAGRFLIRPSLEIRFRRAGIIVAKIKKPH